MLRISEHSLSRSARRVRWAVLGGVVTPLVGAYCYGQGYRMPLLTCPVLHLTGIPCPACGMTRSFTAIAQGNLSQAVTHHLFGPILFAGFVIAAVHITIELLLMRQIRTSYISTVGDRRFLLLCLMATLTYHAHRLWQLANSGELYTGFVQSPLADLLLLIPNFS